MAAMAMGACRCSGVAMMIASMPSFLALSSKLLVWAVDLHVLPGFRLGLPAVDRHQPRADRQQRRLAVLVRPIAVKGAELVEGADVGDGLDLDELGVQGPDQHAPFVAGADHAHPDRRADRRVVAEVEPAQPDAGHGAGGHARLEKVASRNVRGIAHAFRPSRRVPVAALAAAKRFDEKW